MKLLDIARGELGTKESPAGSNSTKYGIWYGMNYQPWCVIFVQWVFHQAGVKMPIRTASCTTLMRAAKEDGSWVTKDYRPGDVVIYDFGDDQKADHCGIVEDVDMDGSLATIEGNTALGNDANGGAVMRRVRSPSVVMGAFRPEIPPEQDNDPAPAHRAGVEWATENGILQGNAEGDLMLSQSLTRQQFCTMLKRYHDRFN